MKSFLSILIVLCSTFAYSASQTAQPAEVAAALPAVTGKPLSYTIFKLMPATDSSGKAIQVRQVIVKSITVDQLKAAQAQLTIQQALITSRLNLISKL